MENWISVQGLVWLGIAAVLIIAVVLAYRFFKKAFSTAEEPTEANPHVNEQAAQDAAARIIIGETDGSANPEQTKADLLDYFNNAHDPNPQGFFARLWSIF